MLYLCHTTVSKLPTKHTLGGLPSSHKEKGRFWYLESLNLT